MLKAFFSLCVIAVLTGCATVNKKDKIISLVEDYVKTHLESPVREVDQNGVITIGNSEKTYIIDPSGIFTGTIDDDNNEDAIATVVSYHGAFLDLIEHLFLINTNGKLLIQKSIESDMKILSLDQRIITAEVPTHPRSSPLFYCPDCREVFKFRYVAGELVKVE